MNVDVVIMCLTFGETSTELHIFAMLCPQLSNTKMVPPGMISSATLCQALNMPRLLSDIE